MPSTQQQGPSAAEVARRLAENVEAVCRHYLSNGCRTGRYWHVGDVANTPGRSLYVRLSGHRAGKWVDAATGEHGDLLDLISQNRNLPLLRDSLDEACRFLDLPQEFPPTHPQPFRITRDPLDAARRLFASARPISATLADVYLRNRGIRVAPGTLTALRFHPTCFYHAHDGAQREARPALIAAVTDLRGRIMGVERTWLALSGLAKASIPVPRRALGSLLGHGVRLGSGGNVLLAGEGVETILSLKSVMPDMPMVAALSASRLAGLILPPGTARLYVACDADAAGRRAFKHLRLRAQTEGFLALPLWPVIGDFNDDLRAFGLPALASALRGQLAPEDRRHLGDK
ncbi:MAG: DNA primase [Hyphomicrobiales bacterium]|nr:MAG: DNA primase [Hyphomicrobiales bacterium]